ncbi:MAG: hypothetical protein WBF58_00065 [Xanthobacteraceae bacterium]
MTDYQPLIARAIDGLAKNTGEARRTLYERARTALVAQLRAVQPSLSESDITKERLALEDAIRKVEGEAARKALVEPRTPLRPEPRQESRVSGPAAPPPLSRPLLAQSRAPSLLGSGMAPRGNRPHAAVAELPSSVHADTAESDPLLPPHSEDAIGAAATNAAPKASARNRILQARTSSLSSGGAKAFRGFGPETDNLGTANLGISPSRAPIGRDGREAYVPAPPRQRAARDEDLFAPPDRDAPDEHFDEDHFDRDAAPSAEEYSLPLRGLEAPYMEDEETVPSARYARSHPVRHAQVEEDRYDEPRPPRSYRGWANLAMLLLVVVVAGAGAWEYRGNIAGLYHFIARSKSQPPAHTPQTTPPVKSTARVPQETAPGTAPAAGAAGASPGGQQGSQVAQRAVLYEADANDPKGKRFAGSVLWRTETVSPGPGLAPELVVHADISIPDRHMAVTWSLRRNTDKELPASHTIEIAFNLPPDFSGGGIANVPGILMKDSEEVRGMPLAGEAVKVTKGLFLIGLNSADAEMQRNVQLLKERAWFDILIVYDNGSRAILTLEKGAPGAHAFSEAFAAWKE